MKVSQNLSFHGANACVRKKKGRKKKRKMEKKENESGDKKQLGHRIWGGKIMKWGKPCRISKETDFSC